MDTSRRHIAAAVLYVCLVLALVIALAVQVRTGSGLVHLDRSIQQSVTASRTPGLTAWARVLTTIGRILVVAIVALIVTAVAAIRRDDEAVVLLAVGLATSSVLVVGIKSIVGRARPPVIDMTGPAPHSFSFPSGHTTASTILYGILLLLAWRRTGNRWARAALAAVFVAVVGGVGWSRVYLGFHWATDVLAGWLLGSAVLVALAVWRPPSLGRRQPT